MLVANELSFDQQELVMELLPGLLKSPGRVTWPAMERLELIAEDLLG